MSVDLNKATKRLKESMEQIDKSIDKVFLDMNATFVEMDKVFDDIDDMFDDIAGGTIETTITGKKTTIKIDTYGNVTVNGKKFVPDEPKAEPSKKFDDVKRADPKVNPLAEETVTMWNKITDLFK